MILTCMRSIVRLAREVGDGLPNADLELPGRDEWSSDVEFGDVVNGNVESNGELATEIVSVGPTGNLKGDGRVRPRVFRRCRGGVGNVEGGTEEKPRVASVIDGFLGNSSIHHVHAGLEALKRAIGIIAEDGDDPDGAGAGEIVESPGAFPRSFDGSLGRLL